MRKRIAALVAAVTLLGGGSAQASANIDNIDDTALGVAAVQEVVDQSAFVGPQNFRAPIVVNEDGNVVPNVGILSALACERQTWGLSVCEELGTPWMTFEDRGTDELFPYFLRWVSGVWSCVAFEDASGFCIDFSGQGQLRVFEDYGPGVFAATPETLRFVSRGQWHFYVPTAADPNLQFPLLMWDMSVPEEVQPAAF